MTNIAIIFAGGVGQRMGSSIPKQFLNVYGKPIIIHTLEKFQYHPEIDKIYVACKKDLIPYNLLVRLVLCKIQVSAVIPAPVYNKAEVAVAAELSPIILFA